jgi:hypothetical protein
MEYQSCAKRPGLCQLFGIKGVRGLTSNLVIVTEVSTGFSLFLHE